MSSSLVVQQEAARDSGSGSTQTDVSEMSTAVCNGGEYGKQKERNTIFDGYHVDCKEGDSMITFDLPSGKQWRKRIWPRKDHPKMLHRWNTAEEILSYLISFEQHEEWISTYVPQTPPSGTILFFDRKQTKKYRSDGYDWKTRKTSNKQVREDRMKLKVAGYQLLYGCYAHSASNPDFHRRTYWLIQNPNVIMVHYLETVSKFVNNGHYITSLGDQVCTQLDGFLTPSNWDMLSISDCNLCAILSMATPAESTESIISQLAIVLALNVQRALSLEEAIEINNTGLPIDKFEESRSKKVKNYQKEVEISVDPNAEMHPSAVVVNESDTQEPVNGIHPAAVNPNNSVGSTLPNSKEFLQVLSKSPHIIVCYPQNGPMSYVLTVPTSSASSSPTANNAHHHHHHSAILPSPVADKDGKLPLPPVYIPPLAERSMVAATENSVKPGVKRGTKGKERVSRAPATPTVTQVLASLLKNAEDRIRFSNEDTHDVQTLPTSGTEQRKDNVSKDDYNPECFTEFANYLLTMDPLEASRVEESGLLFPLQNGERTNRPSSMESSSSELTDSLGRESGSGIAPPSRVATCSDEGARQMEHMDISVMDCFNQTHMQENCVEMSASENPSSSPSLATLVSKITSDLPTTTPAHFEVSPLGQNKVYVESQQQQQSGINATTSSLQDAINSSGSSNTLLQAETIPDISLNLDSDTLQQLLQLSFSPTNNHLPLSSSSHLHNAPPGDTAAPTTTHNEMPLSPISQFIDNLSPHPNFEHTPTQHNHTSSSLQSTTQDHLLLRTSEVDGFAQNFPNSNFGTAGSATLSNAGLQQPRSINAGSVEVTVPNVVVSTGSGDSVCHDWSSWQTSDSHSIEQWLESTSANSYNSNPNANVETGSHDRTNQSLRGDLPQDICKLISNSQLQRTSETPTLSSTHNNLQPNGEATHLNSHILPDKQLDSFNDMSLPGESFSSADNAIVPSLLETQQNDPSCLARKISNTSTASEPPMLDMLQVPTTTLPYDTDTRHHLSLPNLSLSDSNAEASGSGYASPIPGGRMSSPIHNLGSVSPSNLQDIPEGVQMELKNSFPPYMQYEGDPLNLFDYRSNSPAASSPSLASVSSRSTVSIQDASMFDSDAPSVVELCEMLSESANVKHHDFSHMTLTEREQRQLFRAAEVIQNAFRKYKDRRQTRDKEKSAALLIENYYKKYREVKQQKDQAARRIQQQYRVYKSRTRELNRAAVCVQQMYRYHKRRQQGRMLQADEQTPYM